MPLGFGVTGGDMGVPDVEHVVERDVTNDEASGGNTARIPSCYGRSDYGRADRVLWASGWKRHMEGWY